MSWWYVIPMAFVNMIFLYSIHDKLYTCIVISVQSFPDDIFYYYWWPIILDSLWNLQWPFLLNFEVKPFSKGRKWIHCNRFIRVNHRPFIIEHQVVQEHNHLSASILTTNARMRTTSECQISERGWSGSSKPRWIKSFWIWEKFRGHVWAPNMPK